MQLASSWLSYWLQFNLVSIIFNYFLDWFNCFSFFFYRLNCYQVQSSFDARSIYAVEIHSQTYIDYLELKICSGGKCCISSAFNNIYSGTSTLFRDVLLRDCDGFEIDNNEYSIHPLHGNGPLKAVSIYSTIFKLISPMDTCYSEDFFKCQVSYFRILDPHIQSKAFNCVFRYPLNTKLVA